MSSQSPPAVALRSDMKYPDLVLTYKDVLRCRDQKLVSPVRAKHVRTWLLDVLSREEDVRTAARRDQIAHLKNGHKEKAVNIVHSEYGIFSPTDGGCDSCRIKHNAYVHSN